VPNEHISPYGAGNFSDTFALRGSINISRFTWNMPLIVAHNKYVQTATEFVNAINSLQHIDSYIYQLLQH
jgi:hypothetical protein